MDQPEPERIEPVEVPITKQLDYLPNKTIEKEI